MLENKWVENMVDIKEKLNTKKIKEVRKTMYFTTPIYYVNDNPHIGHIFTTVSADFLTRFYKSFGYDTYFLTGTDEHGQKIAKTAQKKNLTPRNFTDTIVPKFFNVLKKMHVEISNFIRTTDKEHEELVQKWFQTMYDNGDIYKGTYKGKYCVDCEGYYGDDELLEGDLCPIHKKQVTIMEEESYFFKLSKYEAYIKELFAKSDFIFPEKYKGEASQRLSQGLKDVSISRKSTDWGVQVPFDKKHVVWVWFDALINYISGLQGKMKYWPATHIIGKDIFWFHCVLWPAMLKSMGYSAPRFFVHGWWTRDGSKMSKSLGNAITPDILVKYGVDEARFFLLRQMSCGEDSDFNVDLFKERYNELANNVGNLINRVAIISKKNNIDFNKKYSVQQSIKDEIDKTIKGVKEDLKVFKTQNSIVKIMSFAQFLNKYINNNEPWKLVKEDKEKASEVLFNLVQGVNALTLLLEPVMPEKMKEARKIFGFKTENLEQAYTNVKEFVLEKPTEINPVILFPKVDKFEF